MKWRILVSAPYMQPVIEQFRARFEQHDAEFILPVVQERLSEAELLRLVGDIDGVIAGDDHFTRRVIEKAVPRLRVISKWGTGIDAFDQQACLEFGVTITNTPNAFTDPVADSAMSYILSFARRTPWMDRQMKAGVWDKLPGHALNESTLGIIGVGNIGKAITRRAKGFGMRVIGYDILKVPTEFIQETGIEITSTYTDLLQQADYVCMCCDLNSTSHQLMNTQTFELMKNSAVLLNLARGPIVKQADLIAALVDGHIAGACLDVFEDEPLAKSSALLKMDNVLLAPHNSNSSPKAWARIHENTLKNLFETLSKS